MKPVKTAIVGCGMISNIYIKNFQHMFSIIDLAALCDMDEKAAKEKAEKYGVAKIMTMEEICQSREIELVVNLTGPAAHYSVIKQLLEHGKHVFTEKVLSIHFEEARELAALAEEKNVFLGVAPDTFLGAGLQTARKALDSGWIGNPTSCVAAINRNQPFNSEVFGYIKKEGGGFPCDVGVYYLTALLSLLGPVEKVTGFCSLEGKTHEGKLIYNGNYGQRWTMADANLMAGALLFQSGVLGSVHFNGESINDEQPHLVIYGTEGIMYLGNPNDFDGFVKIVQNGGEVMEIPMTHGFCGSPIYGEPGAYDYGQHRGVGAAEMAWSMRMGRSCRASKEMGVHVVELLKGMEFSSRKGQTHQMQTTFEQPRPLPSNYLAKELGGFIKGDSETALTY